MWTDFSMTHSVAFDITSFWSDLAILCEDYEITAVQPVDMFPHTMHVENVCALKRKVK